MSVTSNDAIDLIDRLDAAMEVAKGGEYKAMNLARELKKIGLVLSAIEPAAPRFDMDSAE